MPSLYHLTWGQTRQWQANFLRVSQAGITIQGLALAFTLKPRGVLWTDNNNARLPLRVPGKPHLLALDLSHPHFALGFLNET